MKFDDFAVDFSALCKKYDIERLEIFGSFARGDANADSDIDFIVKFHGQKNLADRFFGFKNEVEAITKHHVDIIPDKAYRNPIFARNVNKDRRMVYG